MISIKVFLIQSDVVDYGVIRIVRRWYWIWLLLPTISWGQLSSEQVEYVNEQVLYLNESIHGLLVAHRIYEGYNQSINKYIDLPSYEINNYSNEDLPDNIFEDPEKWFYERSPRSIYQKLLMDKRRTSLPINSWTFIANTNNTITFVNQERGEIEAVLQSEELSQVASVQTVYAELEKMIEYYDRVKDNVKGVEREMLSSYLSVSLTEQKKQVYTAFIEVHYDIKKAIRQIRKDNQSGVINTVNKVEKELSWLSLCINKITDTGQRAELLRIRDIIGQITEDLRNYIDNPQVPKEYSSFGKGYYYHNVKILTQINRYGNGYVSTLNSFFSKYKWQVIHLIEEPHFLKILYPEKIDIDILKSDSLAPKLDIKELTKPKPEITSYQFAELDSSETDGLTDVMKATPEPSEEKMAVPPSIINVQTITVDTVSFELELYDHRRKDGDRVSINVNGDWLFENISLENKPQRVKLTINPNEPNYIMIKAENVGWMPPNTIGVKYRSKSGRVKNVFLKQDLKENEALQINYKGG